MAFLDFAEPLAKYEHPGELSLEKDKPIHKFPFWGENFEVTFGLKVTRTEETYDWKNVFHFTTGENKDQAGRRIPAAFVRSQNGVAELGLCPGKYEIRSGPKKDCLDT